VKDLRIVSFLPAATEMVYALGLGDSLVGVSHECDFPAAAKTKPIVVRPAIDLDKMSLSEIDVAVAERIGSGQSLYLVDENLLRELRPTLILTQNLCQVCAPSGNELAVALNLLEPKPQVAWMSPHSLADIFLNILDLGKATNRLEETERLVAEYRTRLDMIAAKTKGLPRRPRVFFMEWVDPIYCAGHWVAEMIELAGGVDTLARSGVDSVRIAWDDVVKWSPEVLLVSPCGFNSAKSLEQTPFLESLPGWSELPAVRTGRVFCTDANSYFARPGPRVVEGVELLAHLIHPEVFNWNGPDDAYCMAGSCINAVSRNKLCPECGQSFACTPGQCWCNKLPPVHPTSGTDCLCPACLAKLVGAALARN